MSWEYMNRKLIGILIILFGAAIIVGIVYIIFFYDFKTKELEQPLAEIEVQKPASQEPQLPADTVADRSESNALKDFGEQAYGREFLKRMAVSFAERFGSYSNHSNYNNVVDLKIFMTRGMQVWADNFVDKARSGKENIDIYYGITTKAISSDIKTFDDEVGQAEILVKTQRRESTGSMGNATTFYQNILIKFIKEGGAWKVNSVKWEPK